MQRSKRIVTILLGLIASTAYSFAVESYDCKLLWLISADSDAPNQFKDSFSYLLNEQSLTVALQNLRAYCCSKDLLSDTNKNKICNNVQSANNFPESEYLYDHLVDVAVRKRDGRSTEAYNMGIDGKTREYREYMDQIATKPEGSSPDEIIAKIQERRVPKTSPLIEWYNPETCANTKQRKELESKTLYEKLANICTIARCAYDAMTKDQKPTRDTSIATEIGYENCQLMIDDKIYNEFRYMNNVINQAANRKLQKNLNEYLTNYFARDRLLNLQNKIGETYDAFAVVNRFVQEGTKMCSG